ncbi:MAG TPA: HEAT repeat domain-containing protein [Planctomycetota bacterium]|nr:HEAT repeat domain-containing protein [Planctomycetota bacterium]
MSETIELGENGGPGGPPPAPYRNLWVPLVIVPAVIVVAIVLVFVLFGAISGEEASLDQNLARVVHGGVNDRTQGLFNLVRQVAENQEARGAGRELPWAMEEGFSERVASAWDEVPEEDLKIRLTLAALMSDMGDPAGVGHLEGFLAVSEADDGDGWIRFNTIYLLGKIGLPRAAAARGPIQGFLGSSDGGLRSVAAIALQNLPGEGTAQALVGALTDEVFEVRANAAIALSHLDAPQRGEAAPLLRELLDPATYARERELDREKYTRGELISRNRVRALEALARLDLAEDRALIESLAGAKDLALREAALRAVGKD